jgi:hypothetical protein
LIHESWASAAELNRVRTSTSSERTKFRDIDGLLALARRGVTQGFFSAPPSPRFCLPRVVARHGSLFLRPTFDRLWRIDSTRKF